MIQRFPFTRAHFDLIEPDPVFEGVKARMNLQPLLERGAGTAWVDTATGDVLAVAGYVERRRNVFWLWFLPSARGSRMLLRVCRFFYEWCNSRPPGVRIEATIVATFEPGLRMMAMLGFARETDAPMRLWDGRRDHHQFARIT